MHKKFIQFGMAGLLTLPGIAAAAGAVQLPATNQTACFAENGNPRACAGTGEDGEKLAGVAWPATRFADNANGTVSDKLTGLIWSKHANSPDIKAAAPFVCANAEKDMTWLQSLDHITCLNTNSYKGFADWRLPNLNELESMVNAGVPNTSVYLNTNGFGLGAGLPNTQVQASQYWTSTSDASDLALPSAASAWDMDLLKGDFPFSTLKNDPLLTRAVWPVRGASTIPAQLWRTGQTLCFDEIGAARPCAATGEDGEKLAGAAWPVPRFTPNAGATLALDRVTGLVWATSTLSPGPAACTPGLNLSWQQALTHVACLNTNTYLGRSDWRLPNRKELRSLADYSKGTPALPAGHPFNDQAGLTYWSSTTDAAIPRNAWVISMFDGSLSSAVKAGTLPAWPVSGPDLVAPVLTLNPVTAITNKNNQTIGGTMEAGATVVVKLGAAILPVTVNGTSWNATVSGLVAGANNITVTATGAPGNVATQAATITFTAPDGLISGGSAINIGDALKALRIAVGIIPPSFDDLLRGDVAPMGAPDDKIDAGDALLILKKSVGLPSF